MIAMIQADARRIPLPDRSVDLVVGSPPYMDARTYGIGAQRGARAWVSWMLGVTAEALRVTDGPVVWVVSGVTRDRTYWPACEGLAWRWFDEGWTERGPGTAPDGSAYRPVYWHRVGIPGSGGDQWFRADVEYCLSFKRPGKLPWSDNTACGHPPKWAPGGEMSNRLSDGTRTNQWGKTGSMTGTTATGNKEKATIGKPRPSHRTHTKRSANGTLAEQSYGAPVLANPGNLLRTNVGGNQLGHPLAHENEAPYPTAVPEFFVQSLCPPGGTVLDPFSGSGTTVEAAAKWGRRGIGGDIRPSQCLLGRKRLEHPHAPVAKDRAEDLPGQILMAFGER